MDIKSPARAKLLLKKKQQKKQEKVSYFANTACLYSTVALYIVDFSRIKVSRARASFLHKQNL